MQHDTLFFLILALVVSFTIAFYLYGYRSTLSTRLRWIFGSLRFLSIFLLLLLLINPSLKTISLETVKPKLLVLLDNSKSISYLEDDSQVGDLVEGFKNNTELNQRFELEYYRFGNDLHPLDSLQFVDSHTKISEALFSVRDIYKNQTAPIVLVTDGNQTWGTDYRFIKDRLNQPVYPVVLGDTVQHSDLYIGSIHVNRYAYLKNEFPVEMFVGYTGDETISQEVTVRQGASIVYRNTLTLSPQNNVQLLHFTLLANQTGIQTYEAHITPLPDEKLVSNNTRHFAIEVIDQATQVLIVSDLVHPDLGALHKSIGSNEQRKVVFTTPQEADKHLEESHLVVLYQPNSTFDRVWNQQVQSKSNMLVITGVHTDWNFLNRSQSWFRKNAFNREQVQGVLHTGYSIFQVDDIGFSSFPPLETSLGTLSYSVPHQILLEQKIHQIITESPLAATLETEGMRIGVLDGEGWWRWRAAVYVKHKNFQPFDDFLSAIVQYLASDQQRNRLDVQAEPFYYHHDDVKIKAQFFDQNYIFNSQASLTIVVKNQETQESYSFPFLLRNNYFEVNLSSLPTGNYDFTVTVKDENYSRSGEFSILGYEVERQFLNADTQRLLEISHTQQIYNTANYKSLIDILLEDENFKPIQKSQTKSVFLVDWKWLLFLLVSVLSIEWFIRKYNGLI